MRLFTAITFNEDILDSLYQVVSTLRPMTEKGSFSLKENLHVTLNFIGETDDAASVKKAMEEAASATGNKSFSITIEGFGRFKSGDGSICWMGIKKEEHLWRLQKELADRLTDAGFRLDERDYAPHLTLARRVHFIKGFDIKEFSRSLPVFRQKVDKISLMKSERINGKLTYTEIYSVLLER